MSRVLNIVFNDFTRDSRVRKISRSLASAGHQVNILCLYEDGLEKHYEAEGYTVTRFEIKTRAVKHIAFLRPLMYLEFAWRALMLIRKADMVHVNDVEPIPIALIMRLLSFGRIKFIYDAHELESAKKGVEGLSKKMVLALESMAFPFASGFITISDAVAKYYGDKFKLEPVVLFNCPPHVPYAGKNEGLRTEFGIGEESLIFIYQGSMAPGRGLEHLLDGFALLNGLDQHLVVLGFGRLEETVKDYAQRYGHIHFKPSVPMEELLKVTAGADVGFSMLSRDCENHENTLPNKLFEYISAHIPVVVSPVREMSRIVRELGIGWVLKENSSQAVADLIVQIDSDSLAAYQMALDGLAEEYVWEQQEEKLLGLYRKVTARK